MLEGQDWKGSFSSKRKALEREKPCKKVNEVGAYRARESLV